MGNTRQLIQLIEIKTERNKTIVQALNEGKSELNGLLTDLQDLAITNAEFLKTAYYRTGFQASNVTYHENVLSEALQYDENIVDGVLSLALDAEKGKVRLQVAVDYYQRQTIEKDGILFSFEDIDRDFRKEYTAYCQQQENEAQQRREHLELLQHDEEYALFLELERKFKPHANTQSTGLTPSLPNSGFA